MKKIPKDTQVIRKNIQNKMDKLNVTQSDLARKAGLSRALIHNTLNETINPGIFTLVKITNALDLSLDELTGKKSKKNPELNKIMDEEILDKELLKPLSKTLISPGFNNTAEKFGISLLRDIVYFLILEIVAHPLKEATISSLINATYYIHDYFKGKKQTSVDRHFIAWYVNSQL